jgi:G8 domain
MNWVRLSLIAMCAAVSSVADDSARMPLHFAGRTADGASDPHDHSSALAQLDASRASHVAARNGDWSDPGTWASRVPIAGARVAIPQGVTVTVSVPIAVAALDWVRVEGRLHFSQGNNSQLSVRTVLVTPTGTLSIGAPDSPVDPGKTVRLLFAPRSAAVRRQDSFDMLGGLIALGHVYIYGAPKAGFAMPSNSLLRGVSGLTFLTLPTGWKVGDELLFPAADVASEDEQRHIASISSDGTTIALSSPLRFSHLPPSGVPAEIPVANLTRNVILASTETGALYHRAHVMVMTHDPVHISGAAFRGLGRTTAGRPHTLPTVNDDGRVSAGENPIGRYAVHFHLVSGASRRMSPHVFTDNLIVDSPKHGLVNHGGYVVAENNVTFDIKGSHFVAENGSEIGAFRHNLAVFSRGSGEHIEGRQEGIGDFGHGGHGFWSNSPALVMESNYAFHHSGPAYVIFAAPIEAVEGSQNVFFRGGSRIANFLQDNLDLPLRDMVTAKQVTPTAIPFRFSRNVAANSGRGLEIWHANEVSDHNLQSIVEDCVFWGIRSVGIAITYGANTVVRNSILLGSDPTGCGEGDCDGYIGITTEGTTRNLLIEEVRVAGFFTGIWVPSRGTTDISRSYFANKFNILMYPPHQPGRKTIVADNTFAQHQDGGEDYHFVQGRYLFHGDLSMLFERDPLIVKDDRFPGKAIYRLSQYPASVPFQDSGIPELDGKTAEQIRREYGLAIGGVLAPDDATHVAGIGGLVGGPPIHTAEMADQEKMLGRTDRLQSGTGESYTSNYEQGYATDCCNIHRLVKGKDGERTGWRFLTERHGDRIITRLTYIDTRPPRFELDPRIGLEIHPDDVKYGFLIQGTLYDDDAGPEIVRRTYSKLEVDEKGFVNVPFEYADRAGNLLHQQYRLKVTPGAAKRGSDLFYYVHRASGNQMK